MKQCIEALQKAIGLAATYNSPLVQLNMKHAKDLLKLCIAKDLNQCKHQHLEESADTTSAICKDCGTVLTR